MITVNREIADSIPFCLLFVTHNLQLHYAWILWTCRSMGLLTTHQNSTQMDTVWPSKQFIYQNCCVRKWQQTKPTRYLSNPMFYSTNTQTNLRHWMVLSNEWDHQVWGQSNFVWVTNCWLEDVRFCTLKCRQISRSSLSLLHTLWCVFYTPDLFV